MFDETWTHFVNISGKCFPLRARAELIDRLSSAPMRNFVQLDLRVADSPMLRHRISWSFIESRNGPIKTSKLKDPPPGFSVDYNGEAWHVLTRSFCEWIIGDAMSQKIQHFFEDSAVPEEMMMQALLLNSPFKTSIGPCLWEIVWKPEAFHPETLTMAHSDLLLRSPSLFARKFDQSVDRDILTMIAKKIGWTI